MKLKNTMKIKKRKENSNKKNSMSLNLKFYPKMLGISNNYL